MILVTGATGLVGAHLLFSLVSQGKQVRALKRKGSDTEKTKSIFAVYSNHYLSLFNQIEWVEGDVRDVFSLVDALKDVNQVYHCSALVSFRASDKQLLHETNVEGTRNLVDAALESKVDKFCMISSIGALGTPEQGDTVVTENTPWSPEDKHSNYSLSKFHSELEVWRGVAEGLNAVILNPSIILGAGFWDKGSSLLFNTVANGISYYTKGITGYVDVQDVAKAAIALMESDISGERFIISAENCSYEYIFKTIAKYLDRKPPHKYATPQMTNMAWRLAAVQRLWGKEPNFTRETARSAHSIHHYDNQKIKDAIGFQFKPIEQSIKEIAEIYLAKYPNGIK